MGDDSSLASIAGLLILLLLLSAFFSGSETALMSVNRYRLRHKAREGHRGARIAEKLLKLRDTDKLSYSGYNALATSGTGVDSVVDCLYKLVNQ